VCSRVVKRLDKAKFNQSHNAKKYEKINNFHLVKTLELKKIQRFYLLLQKDYIYTHTIMFGIVTCIKYSTHT